MTVIRALTRTVSPPFYLDLDGDGVAATVFESAPHRSGVLEPGADCNDLDATMYGRTSNAAGVDNDCNGYILGLELLGGVSGDLNGDDLVSIQDLLEFLNYFGSSGFLEADFNFDRTSAWPICCSCSAISATTAEPHCSSDERSCFRWSSA